MRIVYNSDIVGAINKPIVSLVCEALSGGYLLASAANYIIAHKLSTIGAIGINGEYTTDQNFQHETLTQGTFKGVSVLPPSQYCFRNSLKD